jgi:hypothetical protein
MDARDWIEQCLESMQTQKDSIEAELEVIRSKQKKNSKGPTDREVELDNHRERHNYHVSRLELMLRLLDNDNLSVDDINNVKDDVNYYIESNQDPDFQVCSMAPRFVALARTLSTSLPLVCLFVSESPCYECVCYPCITLCSCRHLTCSILVSILALVLCSILALACFAAT